NSEDSMRARLVMLAIAIGILTSLAAPVLAADLPPGELGLLLGLNRLARDVVGEGGKPDWSPMYGLRFGTNMDRRYSFFLDGLYGRFDTVIGQKSRIFETRAGLERNLPLGGSGSDWYVAGALGYADANLPAGLG